ncbi:inner membrane protein YhjD [Rhodococcoides trifolii]|uniref:Inner membrane protein YhjD n=1 Tax=Rhodococcoides trifolii TaxID=908250 RepID=A0A917FXV0_9NOCA|nr:inner membrane protein YhjD [Rhodococcus trifolii]GGG13587.1 inner membrane protein YhjD [Rhodococcus trifolii]
MPDFAAILDRRRKAWPWLDHAVRAGSVYTQQKGDYYAAGITYFSILALVPLLMVAFAIVGFVLSSRPDLLDQLQTAIADNVPGSFGTTISDLVETAIESRTSVGVIGLVGALYAGLGWMANLREALTAMWESQHERSNFLVTKLKDLGALIGLGLALAVSLSLSALGSSGITDRILELLNVDNIVGVGIFVRVVSILVSIVATWAVFIWVIARLPREPVTARSAVRAALIAAVAFEVLKQVGAIYLASVTSGPAGVAFGPIIGLLVFVFITSRLLLFCTTWAATSHENLALAHTPPPDSAIIAPRVEVREGLSGAGVAAVVGAGLLAAVGLSGLRDRLRR